MEHNLFKPQDLTEGKHGVVGNCNGIDMETRYREETPMFAKKILSLFRNKPRILDYGCGVGRLSKEIISQDTLAEVVGVDASMDMIDLAVQNVDDIRFQGMLPQEIHKKCANKPFDIAVLVYVLQHVPAIEIREVLTRIYTNLRPNGAFVYCSSDYRMAIRYDGQGFCDDRFLGVNLQEEISRLFDIEGPLFTDEELNSNDVVKKMITGGSDGLAHPAFICRKKKIDGPLHDAMPDKNQHEITPKAIIEKSPDESGKQRLVLIQKQAPGDVLMGTVALRDLHTAYPGKYITDVRSPASQIFDNNPYITSIDFPDKGREQQIIDALKANPDHDPITEQGITFCNLHYPLIHKSGALGPHFADAMTLYLEEKLKIKIPRTGLRPEIYLNQNEAMWPSPVVDEGYDGKYWVINAGSKKDFPLKQYPYYQEVVNTLKEHVQFVQIGQAEHDHKPLDGVINMVGKTDLRQLFRVIAKSEGVLSCVSLPMHVAAALKKPCVVVAGGREGTRWELYPDHRFIYTNGLLDCCAYDGCWRSKLSECAHVTEGDIPACMKLIDPTEIIVNILKYERARKLIGEGVMV